jgi:hypothetical protein
MGADGARDPFVTAIAGTTDGKRMHVQRKSTDSKAVVDLERGNGEESRLRLKILVPVGSFETHHNRHSSTVWIDNVKP